jgi:hypothetical protein
VETEWAKRESKSLLKAQQNIDDSDTNDVESESDDEAEECIVKGRSMALNAFYRIARNTMSMWFKNSEPLAEEVKLNVWFSCRSKRKCEREFKLHKWNCKVYELHSLLSNGRV